MSDLSSKFTREDIETLLEAVGDWEMIGNHEFHILQAVKQAPMLPKDHEAYDFMVQIKDHYRKIERKIKDEREAKQEKSIFLKAKLLIVRRDLNISQLFDMATATDPNSPMPAPKPETTDEFFGSKDVENSEFGDLSEDIPQGIIPEPVHNVDEIFKKLERAEFFIKDLGVWAHYEKFLASNKS